MSDMERQKVGRPSKYEPWMAKTIEEELSKGYSLQGAAPSIGVVSSTVYKWVADGNYPEFSEAVKRGIDKGLKFMENRLLQMMSGTAKKTKDFDPKAVNMTALIFTMKARYNSIYGDRQRIENVHKGEGNNPLVIEYVKAPSGTAESSVVISDKQKEV